MKKHLKKIIAGVVAFLGIGGVYLGGQINLGPQWIDENAGDVALGTAASAPDPVSPAGSSVVLRCFDGNATTEQLYFTTELNHNWDEGTNLKPHIHWMPSTATAGTTTWYMDYYLSADGIHPNTTGTLSINVVNSGVAWQSVINQFSDITTVGRDIGDQISFRLYRIPTGSDTYPNDACVETFGYHYQVNSLGSRNILTK